MTAIPLSPGILSASQPSKSEKIRQRDTIYGMPKLNFVGLNLAVGRFLVPPAKCIHLSIEQK